MTWFKLIFNKISKAVITSFKYFRWWIRRINFENVALFSISSILSVFSFYSLYLCEPTKFNTANILSNLLTVNGVFSAILISYLLSRVGWTQERVHLTKFIVYYEIHQLDRDDYSISQISTLLRLNRRTVKKYLSMTEQEYGAFLNRQSDRKKELLPYEGFVRKRLEAYPETAAAQTHDWLKEHHAEFPKVDPKTVYNFVHWAREKYNIPVVHSGSRILRTLVLKFCASWFPKTAHS